MQNNDSQFVYSGGLLLPIAIADQLSEEANAAEEREKKISALGRKRDALLDECKKKKEINPGALELGDLSGKWPGPPDSKFLRIFNRKDVESYIENITSASAGDDDIRRVKALVNTLFGRGEFRKLATLGEYWQEKLDDLERRFPVFSVVIEYLRGACAIASIDDDAPILQPMLLVGDAGVGKSFFSSELGRVLGTTMTTTLQMNTVQSNATLSGSASFWANATPGAVFKNLVYGPHANPLIVLEEIDKIGIGLQYDPTASLYQIFEPETAKNNFSDLCFDWLRLDASRVVYVCTANEISSMPSPILSRMKIFDIENPTEGQSAIVIGHIFDAMKRELPMSLWGMQLDNGVVSMLLTLPPRTARNVLRDAVGRAVFRGRKNIILHEDIVVPASELKPTRTIGFLP